MRNADGSTPKATAADAGTTNREFFGTGWYWPTEPYQRLWPTTPEAQEIKLRDHHPPGTQKSTVDTLNPNQMVAAWIVIVLALLGVTGWAAYGLARLIFG